MKRFKIRRLTQLFLVACVLMFLPAVSFAELFISVTIAPPPIPVYVQPPCPAPGYIWTPGYWAWGDDGYYWVPGAWVPAPEPGLLWTPGYWGWDDGAFVWYPGYWGPEVGFYGGIDYGFGYFGVGFVGGEWRGDRFFYNDAVVAVDRSVVTNVYVNNTVIVNRGEESHVSYNGGSGGIQRTADARELGAARQRRFSATSVQEEQKSWASRNPGSRARNNQGRPAVAATSRAGDFSSQSRVAARSAGGNVRPETLNATPKNMPPVRHEKGAGSQSGTAPGTITPQQQHGGNAPFVGPQVKRKGTPAAQGSENTQTEPAERTAPGMKRQSPSLGGEQPTPRGTEPNIRRQPSGSENPHMEQQTAPMERPSVPDASRSRPETRGPSQPANHGFSKPETPSRPETRSEPSRQQSEHGPRPGEKQEGPMGER